MTKLEEARITVDNAKRDANLASERLRQAEEALAATANYPTPVQYITDAPSYSYNDHRVHEDGRITIWLDNNSTGDDRYLGTTILREWIDIGYYISEIDSTVHDNIVITLSQLGD